MSKFCENCGNELEEDTKFCPKCGYNPNHNASIVNVPKTSRTAELVLSIIGGVFGLLGGLFAIVMAAFSSELLVLGLSAIIASIVGIIAGVMVKKDQKLYGVLLIISAIWLLISISAFAIPGTVLLGIAGVLALVRK